jgi:hypothetical protein
VTLLGLLAAGLALALLELGSRSLSLDECFSLWRAPVQSDWWMGDHPVRWKDILENVAHGDAHPPLYYVLLKLWRGVGKLGGDEVWSRLPSVAFHLGTVAFTYLLLRRYASPRAALAGGALGVGSCLLVQFAQEARNYGLSILLALAATYFLLGVLERRRGSAWMCALTALLGMYTYYYLAFLFAAHAAIVLVRAVRDRGFRPAAGIWLAGQLAAAALFAPWALWVLPEKVGQVSDALGIAPRLLSPADLWQLATDLVAGEPAWAGKAPLVAIVCAALAAQAVLAWRRRLAERGPLPLVLVASITGSVALMTVFPAKAHVFEGRHLAYLSPLLLCLAVWAAPAGAWRWSLPGLLAAVNLASLGVYYTHAKQDWQAATAYVYDHVNDGDVVLLNPYYLRVPFFHYYTGQGDPEGRRFVPGYTHHAGEKITLPPSMRGNTYLGPEDFRPRRRHDFWIVEVRGAPVSPPEPRVHEWCRFFYSPAEQRVFPGLYGDVVVTRYEP